MEIVRFQSEMAADLARCYNELVAAVPHYRPIMAEWFTDLRPAYFQSCTQEAVLVARSGPEVVGFVHVGVSAPATHKWHIKGEPGVIRFLSYRPGQRPVGTALLAAAEQWVQERERREVVAGFSGYMYPFYPLPSAHISERISHVPPLFWRAGYTAPESEVFFEWPDFDPPHVERPDIGVEVACHEAQARPRVTEIRVLAKQGDREVGECRMSSLSGDAWRPQLADWCVCDYLYVSEELQGKGLGKYLLATGLAEMRAAGSRHAMISTDWNNYRAYLFYTNFGYRFCDRTFGFRKAIGGESSAAKG